MAAELCSAGGAAHAHGWGHSANHSTTPASWIGASSSGDKRVHAWARAHEQGPHWVQPTDSAAAVACPRPCQHVVVEIADDQSELPADSSWLCAMDEAELQKSVDLYLPEETFMMTDLNSSNDNISCSASEQHSHAQSTTPVSLNSLPTASFSLLGALSLLRPQLQSEMQQAPAAQRRRKRVSIGTTSVVREYEPTGTETGEAALASDCCNAEERKHGMTIHDVCSPTHTEDGPRAENLLLDRLIVTHFEGWALTNPGAIAKFVGGDDLLRQIGPGLIDRLEEMIASLDSGAVRHVGVLPSCVRMGVNHLPHLRTLHTWVVASFQFVSSMEEPPPVSSYGGEAHEMDGSDFETPSAHGNGVNEDTQDQQMGQDEAEMGW